jgi:hypothetical protein
MIFSVYLFITNARLSYWYGKDGKQNTGRSHLGQGREEHFL